MILLLRTGLICVLTACCICCCAQVNDGPYVHYENGGIVVRTVQNGFAERAVFPLSDKADVKVKVSFAERSDWDFSVRLKDSLAVHPVIYGKPDKLLLLSDVEGEFTALRALLMAGGVMDSGYNWTFGTGHLVVCGDLFDRGKNVVEGLWLLYRLEELAYAAGGRVHVILGNHDIMNLSGELRYLDGKYLESAKVLGMDYMRLYDASSELGRWLRTKNVIEKIGDLLCLHAGVSPVVNGLGLDLIGLNALARPYYDNAKRGSELRNTITDSVARKLFEGKTSPFWYRGYFMKPKATVAEVEQTLSMYGVRHIVVGHTIVRGNIGFRYGGRVLGLDVDQHDGDHWAAFFENGVWYKINEKGKRKVLKLNRK